MKPHFFSLHFFLTLCISIFFTLGADKTAAQGHLSLQIENDSLLGADRYYTHGMQINFMPGGEPPAWASRFFPEKAASLASEYSLGQAIFTPAKIGESGQQPKDRPWAGYLYASYALMAKPENASAKVQQGQMLQLTLGHVGPDSGAEWGQKNIHDLIGSTTPKGWENQLRNEPTLNLYYFHKWMLYSKTPGGRDLELSPLVSLALGTPYTYLSGSLALRWGDDLRLDFGPPALHPTYPGSSYFSPGTPWSWYVFAGLEYRRVAYNLFLDGTLFRDGPSIAKRPDVGVVFAGAAIIYRRVRFSLTNVYRAPEFITQKSGDFFGGLNLSLAL